jgi:hypothetical protein
MWNQQNISDDLVATVFMKSCSISSWLIFTVLIQKTCSVLRKLLEIIFVNTGFDESLQVFMRQQTEILFSFSQKGAGDNKYYA